MGSFNIIERTRFSYVGVVMQHLPNIFTQEGVEMKIVYTGEERKLEPYFSAKSVEEYLGTNNPSASAASRMTMIETRIMEYNKSFGQKNEQKEVALYKSNKPAHIHATDGTYTILAVKSSSGLRAKTYYYYNLAVMFLVINTARTSRANELQHFINGEILPSVYKYGEYIGTRKDGIGMRRMLTDTIKRGIDGNELTDKAYSDVTDAVYFIRYGLHTNALRAVMGLAPEANIREALSQDELRILGEIENKVSGCIDAGMTIWEVSQNKRLIKLYRKPLV